MDFINELCTNLKKGDSEFQLYEEPPVLLRRPLIFNNNAGKVQKAPVNSHNTSKPNLPVPTRLSVIADQIPDDYEERELQLLELKKKQRERQKHEEELRNRQKVSALVHDLPTVAPLMNSETSRVHNSSAGGHSSEANLIEVGDYKVKVDYQLGAGGYSNVYSVVDQLTQKHYALKVVNLEGIELVQVKQNLLEEVKLLRDLTNVDHVVQLVASRVTDSQALILMEQGTSDLQKLLIDSRDTLDIHFVRYWGGQVLSAVAAVHKYNIVHSDLKPANFLVVKGALKICDFGISNKMPTNGTSVLRSVRIGTLQYMAPETHHECPRVGRPPRRATQLSIDQQKPRSKSSYAEKLLKRKSSIFSPDDSDSTDEVPTARPEMKSSRRSTPNLSLAPGYDLSNNGSSYKVSKASDVWSCGIILYEMVYKANPVVAFLDMHQHDELVNHTIEHPKYSCHGVMVPLSLHEVIRDCLKVNPAERITAQVAFESLFFTPIAIDRAGVLSMVRSAYKFGHELGVKKRDIRPGKMEEQADELFKRLAKLTNGEPRKRRSS